MRTPRFVAGAVTRSPAWALIAALAFGASTGLAQNPEAERDTDFVSMGGLPRVESDPYIGRPTLSLEPTYTDKESEDQFELASKYGRPFDHERWSWQVAVPVEWVDSADQRFSGLSDVSLTLNHNWSKGHKRQAASLQLTANSASDPALGNGQWEVKSMYSIGRWLTTNVSAGLMLSWTYGFDVDSGRTRENVIEPRMLTSFHLRAKRHLTLDLRPRFDLTRHEFYSTLMLLISSPLGRDFGGQFGFEFPLSQLAAKRVENSRLYVDLSHGW
jgi:hypothetical protein